MPLCPRIKGGSKLLEHMLSLSVTAGPPSIEDLLAVVFSMCEKFLFSLFT